AAATAVAAVDEHAVTQRVVDRAAAIPGRGPRATRPDLGPWATSVHRHRAHVAEPGVERRRAPAERDDARALAVHDAASRERAVVRRADERGAAPAAARGQVES